MTTTREEAHEEAVTRADKAFIEAIKRVKEAWLVCKQANEAYDKAMNLADEAWVAFKRANEEER